MREQVRDLDTTLAMLLERSPRSEELGVALHELILGLAELLRPGLPFQLVEQWLGIKRFEVARPTGHEQKDHGPRFRRKMGWLGRQRVVVACTSAGLLFVQQRG